MVSSRTTFLIGLTISAALHAALYQTAKRYAGLSANESLAERRVEKQAYRVDVPEAAPPPPPPPERNEFGEKAGTGDSVNSSAGEEPQTALNSRPDQASLTRDPTGRGPITPLEPPKPLSQPVITPPLAAVPTPPESRSPAPPPSPFPSFLKPTIPAPPAPDRKATPPTPEAPPSPPTPPFTPSPRPTPSESKPPTPAGGSPMPQSDRDSDLFAKEVSVEFKRGRVSARSGREFKFSRPRGNLSQMVEAAEISFPAVIKFRLTISPDGTIRRVEITRSTGSPSIDRAFLLAMYQSWMEPKLDADGRAVSDETDFTMSIE